MFLYRAAHWPVAVDETFPMRVNKRFKRPMDQQLFSRAAVKGILHASSQNHSESLCYQKLPLCAPFWKNKKRGLIRTTWNSLREKERASGCNSPELSLPEKYYTLPFIAFHSRKVHCVLRVQRVLVFYE